jgi:hypothetical protein
MLLALMLLQAGVVFGDEEIDARRQQRQRERMELLLQSLIKAKAKPANEREFCDAASCPTRCAEIEYYLRQTVKMRGIISEVALIVESHDAKLVPTRVYRVKYEDRRGKPHIDDFILQQHGAEWRVYAHVPPVELDAPAADQPPPKNAVAEKPAAKLPPVEKPAPKQPAADKPSIDDLEADEPELGFVP